MPTKLQACEQIAGKTAKQITASHESWTDFMKTAARLYKYPYHEQLKIYAKRPEATACADETELLTLTDSVLGKLRGMSDEEYAALDLLPDFDAEAE
ncbi:MAG TPA: hypothetical protein DDZ89_04110 [Clostridiales bacterium]|nr:hypothetical protein [Clostridiales bacterium]